MALPSVVPFGFTGFRVGRWSNLLLRRPGHRPSPQSTTVAEGAVLLVAASSAYAISARSARQLRHDSEALARAAHGAQAQATAVAVFEAHNGAALAARHEDAERRLAAAFGRLPRGLTISPKFMAMVDLLFLAIEMGFWYLVSAESLSSHASFQEKVPALLFAVFVPLTGVLSARSGGLQAGRVLWTARGELTARVLVPLVASLVLLAASAAATYYLVAWRYNSGSALGARQVPGTAMGILFALALLVIAFMYAALVDHQGQEDTARDKALEDLGKKAATLEAGLVAARDRWAGAAVRLYEHLDRTLDDVERVLLTGQVMVLAGRAVRGDEPGQVTFTDRTSDVPAMLTRPWAVELDGPAVPLRVIYRAIEVLATYEPDTDADVRADDLRERLQRLYSPAPTTQADPTPADRTGAGTDVGTSPAPAHLSVVGTPEDLEVTPDRELTGA